MNDFYLIIKKHWRDTIAGLALVTLALTAAYGVFTFSLLFVPLWVAILSAASFELTYIGLAVAKLNNEQRIHAKYISSAAVGVSVVYNSLSALFHLAPALLQVIIITSLTVSWAYWVFVILLAILHGAPLAIIAYFLSNLILHRNETDNPTSKEDMRRMMVMNMISRGDNDKQIYEIIKGNAEKSRAYIKAIRDELNA